jgi:hypothetical protein
VSRATQRQCSPRASLLVSAEGRPLRVQQASESEALAGGPKAFDEMADHLDFLRHQSLQSQLLLAAKPTPRWNATRGKAMTNTVHCRRTGRAPLVLHKVFQFGIQTQEECTVVGVVETSEHELVLRKLRIGAKSEERNQRFADLLDYTFAGIPHQMITPRLPLMIFRNMHRPQALHQTGQGGTTLLPSPNDADKLYRRQAAAK